MCFHFSERGSLKRKGLGCIQVEESWGGMCALGGQAEGEGRQPARKGLSERLEGKVYGPQMTEDKQQTQNHQNACQNYRFPGPAWDPPSGRVGDWA